MGAVDGRVGGRGFGCGEGGEAERVEGEEGGGTGGGEEGVGGGKEAEDRGGWHCGFAWMMG